MSYGKCWYCEYWQPGKSRCHKGLCEETGEELGGKTAACGKFWLKEEIRAMMPGRNANVTANRTEGGLRGGGGRDDRGIDQ